MRYLGLDLGTKTLGVAVSDASGLIASTHSTIRFEEEDYDSLLPKVKELVRTLEVRGIVLGLPKNMNNSIGPRGEQTLAFQKKLEDYLGLKVEMQDERLSTVEATNVMILGNMSRRKRKKKVDSVAASIILQTYLDKKKGRE